MSITSTAFVLCLIVLTAIYFLAPKGLQWVVLLAASIGFYAAGGLRTLPYILITALSAYAAALPSERWTGGRRPILPPARS